MHDSDGPICRWAPWWRGIPRSPLCLSCQPLLTHHPSCLPAPSNTPFGPVSRHPFCVIYTRQARQEKVEKDREERKKKLAAKAKDDPDGEPEVGQATATL